MRTDIFSAFTGRICTTSTLGERTQSSHLGSARADPLRSALLQARGQEAVGQVDQRPEDQGKASQPNKKRAAHKEHLCNHGDLFSPSLQLPAMAPRYHLPASNVRATEENLATHARTNSDVMSRDGGLTRSVSTEGPGLSGDGCRARIHAPSLGAPNLSAQLFVSSSCHSPADVWLPSFSRSVSARRCTRAQWPHPCPPSIPSTPAPRSAAPQNSTSSLRTPVPDGSRSSP
jgi:hypothetical protein